MCHDTDPTKYSSGPSPRMVGSWLPEFSLESGWSSALQITLRSPTAVTQMKSKLGL